MSSTVMDFLVDKLFSLSAKMKGDSSKYSSSSFLMSVNNNSLSQQLNPVDLLNGLIGDSIMNGETFNQVMPFKQSLGYQNSNCAFSCFRNFEKSYSHHLSSLAMDIHRHSNSLCEPRYLSNDTLVNHLVKSFFCNQLPEKSRTYKSNFELNKPPVPSASETIMSVSETPSLAKKKCEGTVKCTVVPNALTLNEELANRKTKEMHKRSKKRRRRQKKNQHYDTNSSASVSDDDVDTTITSSLTRVCVVSDNAKFGCTVALSHSRKMAPNILSSFVSVNSGMDEDSEWETYETQQFNSSCHKTDSDIQVSDFGKSKYLELESSQPVDYGNQKTTSFISSFMVPVGSSTDDESDWDSCENEIISDTPEFEFTGLLVASFCTPQYQSLDFNSSVNNSADDDETIKLRIQLQEVNKTWNESTKELEVKPKLPSKVSFAPDETLAEVFPVEIYERKGEWEIYATERLRFKRKIDELEKILSPCLHPDHRLKVFQKISEPIL